MNMRTLGAIIIITTYLLIPVSNQTEIDKLTELINITELEQLDLENWQILIKESFEQDELNAIIGKLVEVGFNETETLEETESSAINRWERNNEQHTYETVIIVHSSRTERIDVSYQMESIKPIFDEKTVKKQLNQSIGNIFTDASRNYTCVKLVVDDIMNEVSLFEKIIDRLAINNIDSLEEEDFMVVSGYTDQWDNAIPVGDSLMNIQLASRKSLGGKITYTIGTPILTTEY